MPTAPFLKHHVLTNTALPYNTYNSIVSNAIQYVGGSTNILTSMKEFAEKRGGFTSQATFVGTIKRFFTWQRWDGAFYLFVNEITGSDSIVYKKQVGSDGAFIAIYDDTGSTQPFDFVVANNRVFFSNGNQYWWYGGVGTTVHPVGIGMPLANVPGSISVTPSGGLSAVNGGYQYVCVYGNSSTGSMSGPSLPSDYSGNFSNQTTHFTFPKSLDTQVDKLHVYRSTDGGGGVYFEIASSPYSHTAGVGTISVSDTTLDVDLSSVTSPVLGINGTFPNGSIPYGLTWYANRVWGFRDNTIYWTGWEEVTNGVEEECWPDDNQWTFPTKVYALAAIQEALLVFTARGIWKITGDSQDTFHRELLFVSLGAKSVANVASLGRAVAWIDTSSSIHLTNGVEEQEISIPIRPDLSGISQATSSITFFVAKGVKWLVVSGNSKLFVYDLDTGNWMPPWTVNATYVYAGESSEGVVDLFAGVGTKVLKYDPSTYLDDGSGYNSTAITCLFNITPDADPGKVGELEYLGIERGGTAPTAIYQGVDEDQGVVSWTDLTSNKTVPGYRSYGSTLKEEWYWSRSPAARRAATKITWPSTNANFQLYSLDFAYKEVSS